MLGLGMSFPYLLFVIFPSLAQHLPKPGKWMNTLKQAMAFPLLLTTLWLIWVLGQVRGVNSVVVVLAGCVALGFSVWLGRRNLKIARMVALVFVLAGVTFIYRSDDVKSEGQTVNQGHWQAFSETKLASLRGQNIFINMTADWCLTCKVNEKLVFDDRDVQELMKAKNVHWLKGDWTRKNEEITRFLNRYDRVGVPFYILFSAKNEAGTTLPEVLTKSSFIEFLNKEFP